MNNLCVDVGYRSLNKYSEQLCGDHIEIVNFDENSKVIVLADGLGSGVKASILSTLTSKIISTMIANGMSVEDCVSAVADTLPVCSERNVAYSTFTIIKIINNEEAEIIQYDNPFVILFRDGENVEFLKTEINIGGKTIYKSRIELMENDLFITVSDGAIYAGDEPTLNFKWQREDIISFMKTFYGVGFTAKTLTTILIDECNKLYKRKPKDDTTVCTIKVRKRNPVNLLIGPPENKEDCYKMMSIFFSKKGKHIICGGTTSSIAAEFLNKPLLPQHDSSDSQIPPTSYIEGVDLVTEGVVTISRVLDYAKDYLNDNESYKKWCYEKDGASQIARMLFEDATDINFFVGKAVNNAHQDPSLSINFNVKMHILKELTDCLKKIGKYIKVSYF